MIRNSTTNHQVVTETNENNVTFTYVEKECVECGEEFRTALQWDKCVDCRPGSGLSLNTGAGDEPLMEYGPHSTGSWVIPNA